MTFDSRLRLLLVCLVCLMAAACNASPTEPESFGTSDALPSTSTTGVRDSTTNAAGADATTTTATPSSTTNAPSTTTAPVIEEVIQGEPVLAGFPSITVLTASSGGGTRPLLEWEPVAEASFYSVVVYDAAGEAYWATITDSTRTYVGGPEQLLEDRPGPRVAEGSAWSVIALAEDGLPLAGSGIAPISP